jgi:hypothetical protein
MRIRCLYSRKRQQNSARTEVSGSVLSGEED